MTALSATLPALGGPEAEMWPLLFQLSEDVPTGWAVVGAQMVILHAAAHGVARPTRTHDVDVLVDLQSLRPNEVARWLQDRGFELAGINPQGVGHEFVRGRLAVDVLATDHAGPRSDRRTVPPARTVEVPGGRGALKRLTTMRVMVGSQDGSLPVPDWIGALVLKARAAVELPGRDKHLRDLALLLALPVDVFALAAELSRRERSHLRRAVSLLDDAAWSSLGGSVDARAGRAAARLITRNVEH